MCVFFCPMFSFCNFGRHDFHHHSIVTHVNNGCVNVEPTFHIWNKIPPVCDHLNEFEGYFNQISNSVPTALVFQNYSFVCRLFHKYIVLTFPLEVKILPNSCFQADLNIHVTIYIHAYSNFLS